MFPAQLWQGGVCVADCYPPIFFDLFPTLFAIVLALLTRRWRYVPLAALIGFVIFIGLELAWRSLFLGERPFAYVAYLASEPGQAALRYLILYVFFLVVVAVVFAIKRALIWILFGDRSLVLRSAAFAGLVAVLGASAFAYMFIAMPDALPRRMAERAHEFAGNAPKRCQAGDAALVEGLPRFTGYKQAERGANVVVGMPQAYVAFPPAYSTYMSFEHMLTRRGVIHVPDPKRYEPLRAIAVEVAVSESGKVLAVKPTAGPEDLFPRAIDIASRWQFLPFTRDGKPTAVRLVRVSVPIGGPEFWARRIDTPTVSDWDTVVVKLERNEYADGLTLEIRGDGSVTYDGDGHYLALKGRHCAVIPRETIKALVREIERADFFSMQEEYAADAQMTITVALDDAVKRVRAYRRLEEGQYAQAPEKFWHLIDAILESVHAERWTKGNKFTAPSLVAERWDFKRSDVDNVLMLADVAENGSFDAVRDLLLLNAPVNTSPQEAKRPYRAPYTAHTALEHAAARGSFDIVRLLLDAPIQWSADALGGAYVGALAQGNDQIADELLRRGANRLAIGSYEDMDALMAAALSGIPDAVSAVLKQKPKVNAQNRGEIAPLHWAAGLDYTTAIDSARVDRRRVIGMLIKAGANIDIQNNVGETPLIVNWMGREDVTDALIKHGANVNAVADYYGETALMTNKSVRSVEMLLAAGADPYIRNKKGQNALDVALADEFAQDIVPVLEKWMASHPPKPARP